jgi:integrase
VSQASVWQTISVARAPDSHDLRHTFGTLAVQEFALSDVKAYMGHADITTTMIYVNHIPQHDATERLSARLAKTSGAAATLGRAAAQVG